MYPTSAAAAKRPAKRGFVGNRLAAAGAGPVPSNAADRGGAHGSTPAGTRPRLAGSGGGARRRARRRACRAGTAQAGEVDGAIRLYSQAIAADELEPHNLAVAFYNRGNAYSAKRRYDLAIADFDFAVKLNPEYTIAYNNLANAHVAAGDYDRAVAVYDIAIRLRPDYALGYKNRGNAHAAAGRHEAAIADYDTAIGFDPRLASAYNNRGKANFFVGRFADATRDFQAALELDPSDAYTVLWL